MVKRLTKTLRFSWPFVVALACLLFDWFDAWSETFCTRISRLWDGALLVCMGVFVLMFLAEFAYLFSRRSRRERLLVGILLILFPLLALGHSLRAHFFFVGALSRIACAGGPKSLQTDATLMMQSASDGEVPQPGWPSGVTMIHPLSVSVDKQKGTTHLHFLPRDHFADRFGLLIVRPGSALCESDTLYFRLWRVSDGIWFYQEAY